MNSICKPSPDLRDAPSPAILFLWPCVFVSHHMFYDAVQLATAGCWRAFGLFEPCQFHEPL